MWALHSERLQIHCTIRNSISNHIHTFVFRNVDSNRAMLCTYLCNTVYLFAN